MTRWGGLALAAALALPVMALPSATASGSSGASALQPVDVDGDCHDDLPGAVDATSTAQLGLRLALLVDDGVSPARVRELTQVVTGIFAAIDVRLSVQVRRVSVSGRDVRDLIAQAKALVGGRPPAGAQVVHLITPVDLMSQGDDSSIGLADCIGGVARPERAFSVSELSEQVRGITLGPVTGSGDEEARSIAHEVGHLLGARHEHANCLEGSPRAAPTDTPCTLMFLAAPSSDAFGSVERAVVRGYLRSVAGPPIGVHAVADQVTDRP